MTKQIERLVESSYSDLSPSHHIEEELLDRLPPQRPRPKLALPIGIAAVVMISFGVAFLQGDEDAGYAEDGDGPDLALATVARPPTGVVAGAKDDIHIRLLFEGRIRVEQNDKWTTVSLDQLGEHLRGTDPKRRIVIGIDRNAPWQHVQWIMVVCAQERLANLAFAVEDKNGDFYNLDATLPTDLGVHNDAAPQPKRVRIRVHPKHEKEAPWRGATILLTSAVDFSVDRGDAVGLDPFTRKLAARRERTPGLRGEILAPGRTPFWMVADAIAAVRRARLGGLQFYGTAVPTKEVRATSALPFPRRQRNNGPVLKFELVEGDLKDLPRTVVLLRERARVSGSLGTDQLAYTDTGIEWRLWADEDAELAQQIVERQGVSLEFHITVEKDEPEFEREWKRRQNGEKPSDGFRWYELGKTAKSDYPRLRLPDDGTPVVLCRTDDYGITKASLRDVAAMKTTWGDSRWAVSFGVRKEHQDNLAKLTQTPGQHLAIILDGRVHSAPVLRERLRSSAHISGDFSERDAHALAVLLQSPALPVRLKLQRR